MSLSHSARCSGAQHLMHHAEQVGAEHIHVDLFAELDGNCATTRSASYLARSNRRSPTACTGGTAD